MELSKREVKLLRYLVQGKLNREIADEQHILENSVRRELNTIYRKINVHNRTEAAIKAISEYAIYPKKLIKGEIINA